MNSVSVVAERTCRRTEWFHSRIHIDFTAYDFMCLLFDLREKSFYNQKSARDNFKFSS